MSTIKRVKHCHITQSDKDKVHKFILSYIYIYIYNITILATSHKVTKTIFDKTKTMTTKYYTHR